MRLLMISGDRSILQGKKGAFWYTLEELSKHWERIDVICPRAVEGVSDKWLVVSKNTTHYSLPTTYSPFSNVFFHPSPRHLWYQPWWILTKGDELIAQHRHDVMTVHEYPPFYNGIGARWLHRATGIPFVEEVHHIEWKLLSKLFLWWNARIANAVRVVNAGVLETLAQWGIPRRKIHIVPSFYLDTEALRPDPAIRKEYDLVFCARLVRDKGLEDLLRAVNAFPSVRLLVIGDGPDRAHSEREAQRLGVASRVRFRGWLASREDVATAIQSADAMVVCSREEGGPRVALEAMALGMPLITTRVGVLPEVIEDGVNGVFTDGTIQSLITAIRRVLGDESLQQKLGERAREITKRFERAKLVKEYADFLKRSSEVPQ